MDTRPKPATDGSRADLGDLLMYALDVRRCTRTPNGEVVERVRSDDGAVTERVIACLRPEGVDIDNGRETFPHARRSALAEAFGCALGDTALTGGDHDEREWMRGGHLGARVRADGWCYGLHGRSRLVVAGRLSADVRALMRTA